MLSTVLLSQVSDYVVGNGLLQVTSTDYRNYFMQILVSVEPRTYNLNTYTMDTLYSIFIATTYTLNRLNQPHCVYAYTGCSLVLTSMVGNVARI